MRLIICLITINKGEKNESRTRSITTTIPEEKHKRRKVAMVSFSETVVQYHPTFEARKALVEKIGNYRNK